MKLIETLQQLNGRGNIEAGSDFVTIDWYINVRDIYPLNLPEPVKAQIMKAKRIEARAQSLLGYGEGRQLLWEAHMERWSSGEHAQHKQWMPANRVDWFNNRRRNCEYYVIRNFGAGKVLQWDGQNVTGEEAKP
jgi:hypothetical protein